MYCSLKEAFRIPDFDSAGKVKKSCAAQRNAPADANDPYFPEAGNGETARFRPSYAEGFTNAPQLPASREKIAYRAKVPDYDYYCSAYGLCPDTKVEGFQVQNKSAGSPNAAPVPPPSQNPRACSPPTPQRYEVPISSESRAAYDQAIKASLEQGSRGMTAPYVPERRTVDMDKVSGYYDEDLEQYLQTTSEWKSYGPVSPITPPERKQNDVKADDYSDTPFSRAQQYFEKVPSRTPASEKPTQPLTYGMTETPRTTYVTKPVSEPKGSAWQNMWDLLVFILAGVLIIVLCEQLFKVAMMVGMRRTIDLLEPILEGKRFMA